VSVFKQPHPVTQISFLAVVNLKHGHIEVSVMGFREEVAEGRGVKDEIFGLTEAFSLGTMEPCPAQEVYARLLALLCQV